MVTKVEEIVIEHPMEDIFDIPTGTTTIVREVQDTTTELVKSPQYDEKDNEIEKQTQEVYDHAITAFREQIQQAALVDPRYASRSTEVALQALSIALESIKQKSNVKGQKDKLFITSQKGPSTINNNLIVSSRNELLKKLMDEDEGE